MTPTVEVFDDPLALTERATALFIEAYEKRSGTLFRVGLSGGHTPAALYRRLAAETRIDWKEVLLALEDERRVPFDHLESNQRMIRQALLSRLTKQPAFLAPDGSAADWDKAAETYGMTLRTELSEGGLDLLLLGMGPDGHTASLFPDSPALLEMNKWALAVPAPTTVPPPIPRITLTPAVILRSWQMLVLVEGSNKAAALARALAPEGSEAECPIRLVHRCKGPVTFLCDRAAAAQWLSSRGSPPKLPKGRPRGGSPA